MSSLKERLDLLRPTLDQYTRRFTVLDLGSGIEPNQNVGQQIAREYPNAIVVAVEKDWTREKFEPSPRTIVLARKFDVNDILRLSQCEHFDVVLGLNILHWFGEDALPVLVTLMRMGDYIFVQIPKTTDITACGQETLEPLNYYLEKTNWNWDKIGETIQFPAHNSRPLWMYENKNRNNHLTRTWFDGHEDSADIQIRADFGKIRCFIKGKWRDWVSGINLWNFCNLGGVWPEKVHILDMMWQTLPKNPHGDIAAHNMILDGERLVLIDGGDDWKGHKDDETALAIAIERVRNQLGYPVHGGHKL